MAIVDPAARHLSRIVRCGLPDSGLIFIILSIAAALGKPS
jgi:hypothetical protein